MTLKIHCICLTEQINFATTFFGDYNNLNGGLTMRLEIHCICSTEQFNFAATFSGDYNNLNSGLTLQRNF